WRRSPQSPLFPFPTLFRSRGRDQLELESVRKTGFRQQFPGPIDIALPWLGLPGERMVGWHVVVVANRAVAKEHRVNKCRPVQRRSEEHTSELQSRENLVCR